MNKRFKPEVRKEQIIQAARTIAKRSGFSALSRQAVAAEVGVSGQAINYHFGTLKQLERAVKRSAIADEDLQLIGQLVVMKDPLIAKLAPDIRRAAVGVFL